MQERFPPRLWNCFVIDVQNGALSCVHVRAGFVKKAVKIAAKQPGSRWMIDGKAYLHKFYTALTD
jgi:hypothetical protein